MPQEFSPAVPGDAGPGQGVQARLVASWIGDPCRAPTVIGVSIENLGGSDIVLPRHTGIQTGQAISVVIHSGERKYNSHHYALLPYAPWTMDAGDFVTVTPGGTYRYEVDLGAGGDMHLGIFDRRYREMLESGGNIEITFSAPATLLDFGVFSEEMVSNTLECPGRAA